MIKDNLHKLILFIIIFFIMLCPIGILAANDSNNISTDEILVVFKNNITIKKAKKMVNNNNDFYIETISTNSNDITVISTDEKNIEKEMKKYSENENVLYVQPNYIYSLAEQDETPAYSSINDFYVNSYTDKKWQYHLYYTKVSNIYSNRPSCWDYATGKGIKIGILDTGTNPNLKEYANNIKGSYDAVKDKSPLNNDVDSHGTHVTAIAGAKGDNNLLGAGVAYNCDLYPVNVFHQNSKGELVASTSNIIKGFNYLLEQDVKIINMSFGEYLKDSDDDKLFMDMINNAYETKDVISVCAGGNGNEINMGYSDFYFPADTKNAISVTAVQYTKATDNRDYSKVSITPWSNHNKYKDIAAPGSNIYSLGTTKDENNQEIETLISKSGTSMSSPFVAGVIALIKEVNPSLSAKEIKDVLYSTCIDLGSKGKDNYYGNGMINPLKAVKKALWQTSVFYLDKYEVYNETNEIKLTANMKVPTFMTFEVYDENENLVDTIYSSQDTKKATHIATWDLKDKDGNSILCGQYTIKAVLPFIDNNDKYTEKQYIIVHSNVDLNLSSSNIDVTKEKYIDINLNANFDSFLENIEIKNSNGDLIKTIDINDNIIKNEQRKIRWNLTDNSDKLITKNGTYIITLNSNYNDEKWSTYKKVNIDKINSLSLNIKKADKTKVINYNNTISISANLNKSAFTKIYIKDANNNTVKTLLNKKVKDINAKWDLKDNNKKYVTKGDYTVTITSNDGFNTVTKSYTLTLKNPEKIKITKAKLKNNKLSFNLNTFGKSTIIVKNKNNKTIQTITKTVKKGFNSFKVKKQAKYITIKADNISSSSKVKVKK